MLRVTPISPWPMRTSSGGNICTLSAVSEVMVENMHVRYRMM